MNSLCELYIVTTATIHLFTYIARILLMMYDIFKKHSRRYLQWSMVYWKSGNKHVNLRYGIYKKTKLITGGEILDLLTSDVHWLI